jgi:hypothetical protein
MPRSDYSITVCLIFLGLVVLVRTVAIAQHACGLLLPLGSCEYWVPPVAAVAIGQPDSPTESSSAESPVSSAPRPVVSVPSVINARSGEYPAPPVAAKNPSELVGLPAQNQIQVASEKQRKRIAPTKTIQGHYETSSMPKDGYTYRSNGSQFENTWAAAVW